MMLQSQLHTEHPPHSEEKIIPHVKRLHQPAQ